MENNTPTNEKVAERQADDKAKLLECFRKIPIIEVACSKCALNRTTYYRWLEDDPDFEQKAQLALIEGEEFISDKSEAQMIALIGEKNLPAIKHWLSHHRQIYKKDRGRDGQDQKIRIILIPNDTKK